MYVCVTVFSLVMRVPLLSPKSQVKATSELLRYWLGSWRLMLKETARFWTKLWSAWFRSLTWVRVTLKGIWSEEREIFVMNEKLFVRSHSMMSKDQ